jgi:hypothetical protein
MVGQFFLFLFRSLSYTHRRKQLLMGWIPTPAPMMTMMQWAQETLVSWVFFFSFLFRFSGTGDVHLLGPPAIHPTPMSACS